MNGHMARRMAWVVLLALAAGLARADIVTGLQAHWMLDETSGITAFDATGNAHHATFDTNFSVETMGVPGVLGTAYDFEADHTFVLDAGSTLQLSGGNAATVAAFIRPESFRGGSGSGSRNGIIGDTTFDIMFMLQDQGRLGFTWDAGVNSYQGIQADAGDEVPRSSFSHVAITRNGADMRLYIDGQEVKSATVSASNFATFGNMQLGRVNGTSGRDFDGRIDDLRVYNRALSPSDIEELADQSATHVLVADAGTDRVLRYRVVGSTWTPDGIFAAGTYAGQGLDIPWGLAQAPNHMVYVGEQKDGGRILRLDQFGNFVGVVATEGAQFTGRPEALTIGPDGNLYMSVAFGAVSDRIYKIDLASNTTSLFVPTSGAGYTLNNPRGIAFGSDGNLYVASRDTDEILKFDGTTGAWLADLATPDSPQGLDWDDDNGRLLASVFGPVDWFEYSLDGTGTKIYDATAGFTPSFAVINGAVYGTDYFGNRLMRLVDINNLDTVISGLSLPGHMLEYSDTPEPGTMALLGFGLAALARRRRRRAAKA